MKWYRLRTASGLHRETAHAPADGAAPSRLEAGRDEAACVEFGAGVGQPEADAAGNCHTFWKTPPASNTISSSSSTDPTHVVSRIWRMLRTWLELPLRV